MRQPACPVPCAQTDLFVNFPLGVRTQDAAERKIEFMAGIFGDPLWLGDWPPAVRARIPYLPKFSSQQARSPQPAAADVRSMTTVFLFKFVWLNLLIKLVWSNLVKLGQIWSMYDCIASDSVWYELRSTCE